MERYQRIKDHVYGKFNAIYNEILRANAMTHTNAVDNFITFLAISRNLNLELCKICALFHDFSQYTQNCPHSEHARMSAIYAHNFLSETNLFKISEIDEICYAISQHSKKGQYDSPLCEALKDADVLAHFLEDPTKQFEGIKRERLLNACADLS